MRTKFYLSVLLLAVVLLGAVYYFQTKAGNVIPAPLVPPGETVVRSPPPSPGPIPTTPSGAAPAPIPVPLPVPPPKVSPVTPNQGTSEALPAGVGDNFEIKLGRPVKAGTKYKLSAAAVSKRNIVSTSGPRKPGPGSFEAQVELVAQVEVVDVDAQGLPATSNLTVEKCVLTTDGTPKELLAAGQILVVTAKDGKNTIVLKDGTLSGEAMGPLQGVLPAAHGQKEDELYGTQERKKAGESWPLDVKAVVAETKKHGLSLEPDGVSAISKLAAVREIEGKPCLEVNILVDAENVKAPSQKGYTAKDASIKIATKKVLPVDVSLPEVSEAQTITVHYIMESPAGPNGTAGMDITTEQTHLVSYTY